MPGGRKPIYRPEDHKESILEWISQGFTLRDWCRQPGRPNNVTVYGWLGKDAIFSERLARARELGHDSIAEQCVEIADTEEDPNKAKVRVWTRLQLLKCWNPKKYGDKVELAGEIAVKRVIADV